MHAARIPLELCELVIDCLCDALELTRTPDYRALKACALTCSSWLPRTRRNLYWHIWLRTTKAADILEQTLKSMPHLGHFARLLTVGDGRTLRYIPFARGIFLRLFKHVRCLDLLVPLQQYPPLYHLLLGRFSAVTELKIAFLSIANGESLRAGFRLIWSLPKVHSCQVWAPEVPRYKAKSLDRDVDVLEDLLAKRERRGVCKNLRNLSLHFMINMGPEAFPPKGAFGQSIHHLEIHISPGGLNRKSGMSYLQDCISRQYDLRTLHITYHPVSSRDVSGSLLPPLLSAVSSHARFMQFSVELDFEVLPPASLSDFDQQLFTSELHAALESFARSESPARFELRVRCEGAERDLSETLSERCRAWTPKVPHSIVVLNQWPERWTATST